MYHLDVTPKYILRTYLFSMSTGRSFLFQELTSLEDLQLRAKAWSAALSAYVVTANLYACLSSPELPCRGMFTSPTKSAISESILGAFWQFPPRSSLFYLAEPWIHSTGPEVIGDALNVQKRFSHFIFAEYDS